MKIVKNSTKAHRDLATDESFLIFKLLTMQTVVRLVSQQLQPQTLTTPQSSSSSSSSGSSSDNNVSPQQETAGKEIGSDNTSNFSTGAASPTSPHCSSTTWVDSLVTETHNTATDLNSSNTSSDVSDKTSVSDSSQSTSSSTATDCSVESLTTKFTTFMLQPLAAQQTLTTSYHCAIYTLNMDTEHKITKICNLFKVTDTPTAAFV